MLPIDPTLPILAMEPMEPMLAMLPIEPMLNKLPIEPIEPAENALPIEPPADTTLPVRAPLPPGLDSEAREHAVQLVAQDQRVRTPPS